MERNYIAALSRVAASSLCIKPNDSNIVTNPSSTIILYDSRTTCSIGISFVISTVNKGGSQEEKVVPVWNLYRKVRKCLVFGWMEEKLQHSYWERLLVWHFSQCQYF